MSVVFVLGVILAIGYGGVALVGFVTWRERMRESLPARGWHPVAVQRSASLQTTNEALAGNARSENAEESRKALRRWGTLQEKRS